MRKRVLTSGLQAMFTPGALVPFLIGSLSLTLLGSALYQLVTNWLGTGNLAAVRIAVGSLTVLLVAAWTLAQFMRRLRPVPPLLGKTPPQPRRGLILLVSNEPTSRKAIEWHQKSLEHCWLFASPQSATIAGKLAEELKSGGKRAKVVLVEDVFDPLEYRDKVDAIFGELPEGVSDRDVVLDFTGMTACASVGAVLACLHEQRAIQYTPARYDTTLKALQPLDPVEVTLHWGMLSSTPELTAHSKSSLSTTAVGAGTAQE